MMSLLIRSRYQLDIETDIKINYNKSNEGYVLTTKSESIITGGIVTIIKTI